jgi:hypothetical protein
MAMKKNLLAKLRETKLVVIPSATVRALDDSDLADVIGGLRDTTTWAHGHPCDTVD